MLTRHAAAVPGPGPPRARWEGRGGEGKGASRRPGQLEARPSAASPRAGASAAGGLPTAEPMQIKCLQTNLPERGDPDLSIMTGRVTTGCTARQPRVPCAAQPQNIRGKRAERLAQAGRSTGTAPPQLRPLWRPSRLEPHGGAWLPGASSHHDAQAVWKLKDRKASTLPAARPTLAGCRGGAESQRSGRKVRGNV